MNEKRKKTTLKTAIYTLRENKVTMESLIKENNFLKNRELELEKKCKYLMHDIYFLNKNIKDLELEKNKYKNYCDSILTFVDEYNIKDISELLSLLSNYKDDKDFNKYKKLEKENKILHSNLIKYEIKEIVNKSFNTNTLYNILNTGKKVMITKNIEDASPKYEINTNSYSYIQYKKYLNSIKYSEYNYYDEIIYDYNESDYSKHKSQIL